jgi:threonyl-tRNA synthetase
MVHRALLGSLERFFGVLVEHYAGAFPLWLAPEQVRVLPLTDRQRPAAEETVARLEREEFRVALDGSAEKIGAKIRDAQMAKIPYMLILGPREVESGTVAVRSRSAGDQGGVRLEAFIGRLREEVANKA